MRSTFAAAALAAISCAVPVTSLNILLGNDDGFGSAQIRETYRLLKKSGHDVVMVAPIDNESGMGGRSVFTSSPTLNGPAAYNLIPAGAPSVGQDPMDSHIWYYNGTPAACTFVGLDYVLPQHFPDFKLDCKMRAEQLDIRELMVPISVRGRSQLRRQSWKLPVYSIRYHGRNVCCYR